MGKTVLIIDDDEKLSELLHHYLGKFGFDIISSAHPSEGLRLLRDRDPSIIILDIMLPDMDGFEVCKLIRKSSRIPIIMLTARGEVTDRIAGLESGADDYLPKPFEPRELVARIQSVLRRTDVGEGSPILTFGLLTVNTEIQEVTIGGELIDLTSTEYELLTLFIKNPGKVLNRDQIMEWVSGIEWELFNRSVDVLVSRLRGKLRDDPKHPIYLKTIWGTGYLFLGRRS